MVRPNLEPLLENGLFVPNVVVALLNGPASLALTNSCNQPVLIHRGFSLALTTPFLATLLIPLDEQPFPTISTPPRVSAHVVLHRLLWRKIHSLLPQAEREAPCHML